MNLEDILRTDDIIKSNDDPNVVFVDSLYQFKLRILLSKIYEKHPDKRIKKECLETFPTTTSQVYCPRDVISSNLISSIINFYNEDDSKIAKEAMNIVCSHLKPSKYGSHYLPIVMTEKLIKKHIPCVWNNYIPKERHLVKYGILNVFYMEESPMVFVIPRPKIIKVNLNANERYQLHCEDGPAFSYDNKEHYCLNGVEVNKYYVCKKPHEIDLEKVMRLRNISQRGVILNKVGVMRVMNHFGSITISKMGDDYELVELNFKDMRRKPRYLKIRDTDTKTFLLEGVPYDINTCQEALNWRISENKWNPDQLT